MQFILNNYEIPATQPEIETRIGEVKAAIKSRQDKAIKALNDDRPEDHDNHIELANNLSKILGKLEAALNNN